MEGIEDTVAMMQKKKVPHYYGDTIRMLFIASAIVHAVAMPLFGNLLPFGNMTELGVILLLVLCAGLTTPHSTFLMMFNVLVAGAGAFFLQSAAVAYFKTDPVFLFLFREISAILLLLAFYYSIKSARNMIAGKVGKTASPGEFDKQ